jgi:hypothetical protein
MKKPAGTIISKNRAMQICSHWHGGQWSALYSFASSKQYRDEWYGDYLKEIENCMAVKQKEALELKSLKRFFDYKHY